MIKPMEKPTCRKCGYTNDPIKITQESNSAYKYHFESGPYILGKICYACIKKLITCEKRLPWTKSYEKTHNGYIMRLYRNMKSRINGIQKSKHHLYKGKCLLPKEEFYSWAKCSKKFYALFEAYKDSGFDRKLAPSVDRIDSSKGYSLDNIEWVTHSENSRRGSKSLARKLSSSKKSFP